MILRDTLVHSILANLANFDVLIRLNEIQQ